MSLNSSHSTEAVFAAGKASPPLAVTGLTIAGTDLQTWVLVATLIYTVLQAAVLVYNFVNDRRKPKED